MKWFFIALTLLNFLMLSQGLVAKGKSASLLAGINAEVDTLRKEINPDRLKELDNSRISGSRDLAGKIITEFHNPILTMELIGLGISIIGMIASVRLENRKRKQCPAID